MDIVILWTEAEGSEAEGYPFSSSTSTTFEETRRSSEASRSGEVLQRQE